MKKLLLFPFLCGLALIASAQQPDSGKAMVQSFLTGLYDETVSPEDLYRLYVQLPGDTTGQAKERDVFTAFVKHARTPSPGIPSYDEVKANFDKGWYTIVSGQEARDMYGSQSWDDAFWETVFAVKDGYGKKRLQTCLVKNGKIASFLGYMKGGDGPYFLTIAESKLSTVKIGYGSKQQSIKH
ncbi:hypothetical protein ACWKWU_05415 [Chitinophaga lutea]